MPTKTIFAFLFGAGLGSAVTYFVVRDYFNKQKDEEVESVRSYYKSNLVHDVKNLVSDETAWNETEEKNEIEEPTSKKNVNYKEIIEKMNYGEYFPKKTESQESTVSVEEEPEKAAYVISVDAFAGDMRNEKVTLYYFENDGVFMNVETEEVVPNGMDLIGEVNFERLGEFEDDVLYVRNDETQSDYEVIVEHYAYAESDYREHEEY